MVINFPRIALTARIYRVESWNMKYVVCLDRQSEPLTPGIIAEYFELCGDQVLWAKTTAKRNRVGDVAGHAVRKPIWGEPGDPPRVFNYGFKVGFGGAIIPAEYLAFALEHSRLPEGKVAHKDGDRENNHPDNLVEVPQPRPNKTGPQFTDIEFHDFCELLNSGKLITRKGETVRRFGKDKCQAMFEQATR